MIGKSGPASSPAPMRAHDAASLSPWTRRLRAGWRSPRWRDVQMWRLGSGLVLFVFVLTHYLNHALGLVSLDAMEGAQAVRTAVWRSWPGTILLYGALATHVGFALARLVMRRAWGVAARGGGENRAGGGVPPPPARDI